MALPIRAWGSMELEPSAAARRMLQLIRDASRQVDAGEDGDALDSAYRQVLAGICGLSEADADLIEPEFSVYEKKLLPQ